MNANIYEKTYVSVKNAVHDTQHLDAVVEFLRKQSEPVTCTAIGEAVFGDQYHSYYMGKSCQGRMGQMLRHLRRGGFLKMEDARESPAALLDEHAVRQIIVADIVDAENLDVGFVVVVDLKDRKARDHAVRHLKHLGVDLAKPL